MGRSYRPQTPRSSHGAWEPRPGRPDPVALLEEQAAERVPELVPIRYGRMSASPLAFFRGAAYVMACDLAGSPHTGIRVQLSGECLHQLQGCLLGHPAIVVRRGEYLPGALLAPRTTLTRC